MKRREDLDAIRYLTDVLHEAHDGPAPTFADEYPTTQEVDEQCEQASPRRSWFAALFPRSSENEV